MAESVKRRVAAARLAVAFVAAGTIAGAATWAQASPAPTAKESVLVSSLKIKLDSSNIKNGSLLFEDFVKGEVASGKQFKKLDSSVTHFKKAASASISTIKGEIGEIKSQLGSYIKGAAADARYLKLTDSVVRGDGAVHTATGFVANSAVTLLNLPNLITVEGLPNSQLRVTNNSGVPFIHTGVGNIPAGSLKAGASEVLMVMSDTTQSLQLISGSTKPIVITLSASGIAFPQGAGSQDTVQILIGL